MSSHEPAKRAAQHCDSGNPAILELMSVGPEALRPRLSAGLPLNENYIRRFNGAECRQPAGFTQPMEYSISISENR